MLVAYKGAKNAPAKAVRTKDQARKLAEDIAKKAAKEDFAQLAKRMSDDAATSSKGGSLGALSSTSAPKPLYEAASALAPGAVSTVVETEEGFHVLKRPGPPAAPPTAPAASAPKLAPKPPVPPPTRPPAPPVRPPPRPRAPGGTHLAAPPPPAAPSPGRRPRQSPPGPCTPRASARSPAPSGSRCRPSSPTSPSSSPSTAHARSPEPC